MMRHNLPRLLGDIWQSKSKSRRSKKWNTWQVQVQVMEGRIIKEVKRGVHALAKEDRKCTGSLTATLLWI